MCARGKRCTAQVQDSRFGEIVPHHRHPHHTLQNTQGVVNITNSFALPFEEDDKDPKIWFLDHNYLENMFAMFKKVNGERAKCSQIA